MSRLGPWFRLFAFVMLLLPALAAPVAAMAQEASPTAGECIAPELPPGTPTPMEELEAMMAGGMEMATPATGEATPTDGDMAPDMAEGAAVPEGTPADEATSARVVAAIENAIGCYNAGEYLSVVALFTEAGRLSEFGLTNPYDAEMFLAGGPPLMITSISDVQVHDDGRYSADVVSSFGGAQIQRERWILVEEGDFLLVDETPDLPVDAPEGAVTIDATMVDFAFELSETTVPANTPLVFTVTNAGEYPHELVIVQLPDGVTIEQALAGEIPEEEIGFMGATFSEGGQPAPDLVLTGLEAGTYTLVCFVDIPEGIPHVMRGMIAELVVE